MNQVVKDFGKGFKQLGQETAEKLVQETGKIAESVITAQELLGDIRPLNDQEIAQKKAEDERKKQEEMSHLRQGFGGQAGRNVESEMEKIRQQNEKEEEERERYFESIKEEQEKQMQEQDVGMEFLVSKKPMKNKGGNPHKKQQPDSSQMSQTSEFKVKI
jgi:hypothetical protein